MSILHNVDFTLGPLSLDMIEPNLYLGGLAAAKNIDILNKYKINYILTIDTCPLPRTILDIKHFKTKYIQLSDQPKEDLLSHFHDADLFIREGMSEGAVLVHCYFGVSRSATVVIAHIMKKYELSYNEALKKVKAKRSIVCPNPGFVSQLKLYKEMNYTIEPNNMHYKIYKLTIVGDRVRRAKLLPGDCMNVIQPDPWREQTDPEPNVYMCKKCRRILASESNLLIHQNKDQEVCRQTYFVEPIAWMQVSGTMQGKLLCPKCSSKLGSFSWIMGCQCPCGIKMAPAFYLTPSKVDYNNVVKNVEFTV